MNWKEKVLGIGVGLLLTTTVQAADVNVRGVHVHDIFKDIIQRKPYTVEVCYDKQTSGDKTGDTLGGAILGGILGKAITGKDDGAALGALFGGIVGHNESNATGGSRTVCRMETRYKETNRRIYSHSTIVFIHEGSQYRITFDKRYP